MKHLPRGDTLTIGGRMATPPRHRQATTTDDSSVRSFGDAISDTLSTLEDSNLSLSSILPPETVGVAEEVRKKQAETAKLLDGLDEDNDTTNIISRTVSSWVRSAANFISSESKSMKDGRRLRRTSSHNILQRRMPISDASASTKIINATDSICSYPNCIQTLNIAVSRFHCRKCNGWYCAIHTGHPSLGMKLVPSTGEADCERGIWSRVCQRCFKERFYNNSEPQPERDYQDTFGERRSSILQEVRGESRQLEHRYRKLTDYGPKGGEGGIRMPFRIYEQQVVKWEEDKSVKNCRICRSPFSTIVRKHHCRLCGQIVCAETTCSLFSPLKFASGGNVEIRICTKCDYVLFKKSEIKSTLRDESDLVSFFGEIRQVKSQISDIMPRFNEQLLRLEYELDREEVVDEQKVIEIRHEASSARDTLMLLFRHCEIVTRKLRSLVARNREERVVISNIQRSALLYLQNHMFTLQMLPKLDLKRLGRPKKEEPPIPPKAPTIGSMASTSLLPALFRTFGWDEFNSPGKETVSIPRPANLTALESKYEVLVEQRHQLERFLTEAVSAGKFDEVRALRTSLEEINHEMSIVKNIVCSHERPV